MQTNLSSRTLTEDELCLFLCSCFNSSKVMRDRLSTVEPKDE